MPLPKLSYADEPSRRLAGGWFRLEPSAVSRGSSAPAPERSDLAVHDSDASGRGGVAPPAQSDYPPVAGAHVAYQLALELAHQPAERSAGRLLQPPSFARGVDRFARGESVGELAASSPELVPQRPSRQAGRLPNVPRQAVALPSSPNKDSFVGGDRSLLLGGKGEAIPRLRQVSLGVSSYVPPRDEPLPSPQAPWHSAGGYLRPSAELPRASLNRRALAS